MRKCNCVTVHAWAWAWFIRKRSKRINAKIKNEAEREQQQQTQRKNFRLVKMTFDDKFMGDERHQPMECRFLHINFTAPPQLHCTQTSKFIGHAWAHGWMESRKTTADNCTLFASHHSFDQRSHSLTNGYDLSIVNDLSFAIDCGCGSV